ncbi:MAG: hypothetical protein PHU70_00490 [Dehalococcoidia bacterium]|nr:hypothetical protein [Dehalococcoidia bacterium]
MIKDLEKKQQLTRLGKIKLGIKVNKDGKEYPRAVDYFVCPPEVQAVFGEKPTELRIVFVAPKNEYPNEAEERDVFTNQSYRWYSRSRGLLCSGDGEISKRWVDTKTGDVPNDKTEPTDKKKVDGICAGQKCPDYIAGNRCRETMFLQFIMPEVVGLGIWQIDTSSYYSMININSTLRLMKAAWGRMTNIPLVLALIEKEVTPKETNRKKKVRVLELRSKYRLMDTPVLELLGQYLLPPADDEVPDVIPEEIPPDTDEVVIDEKTTVTKPKAEKTARQPKPGSGAGQPQQSPNPPQSTSNSNAEPAPEKESRKKEQPPVVPAADLGYNNEMERDEMRKSLIDTLNALGLDGAPKKQRWLSDRGYTKNSKDLTRDEMVKFVALAKQELDFVKQAKNIGNKPAGEENS